MAFCAGHRSRGEGDTGTSTRSAIKAATLAASVSAGGQSTIANSQSLAADRIPSLNFLALVSRRTGDTGNAKPSPALPHVMADCWGSASITATLRPALWAWPARLIVVVVFAAPPFSFKTAIICMNDCSPMTDDYELLISKCQFLYAPTSRYASNSVRYTALQLGQPPFAPASSKGRNNTNV